MATSRTSRKSTASTATAKEEFDVPGLERVVLLKRLSATLAAVAKAAESELKPFLSTYYFDKAAKSDEFPSTFRGFEGHVGADAQLKVKPLKNGLTAAEVLRFKNADIPTKIEPRKWRVAKNYSDNDAAFLALKKLIEANPDSGVPADFLKETVPVTVPDDSAILKILRHPDRDIARDLLGIIRNIVLLDTVIDDEAALTRFAIAHIATFIAAAPQGESEDDDPTW